MGGTPCLHTAFSSRVIGSLLDAFLGCGASLLRSRPSASWKVNPRTAPPSPLISPANRARGQENRSPWFALWAASKIENLMDDEPLLITSMCRPPPGRIWRLFPSYTYHVGHR